MRKTNYSSVFSFLIILIAVYFGFYPLSNSNSIISKNNSSNFSTENALHHLKEITKKPHYVGSEEHNVVRNYIVNELEKLGLEVQIQEQIAINKKWKAATNTKNIIAKIEGSNSSKSLLLLSHYDSNPHSSLGASDAGSGVVTILEGIRVFLASGVKPKNDIIILISDAEELGLLGANAFVNHHPWAKEVGLVLNFEARGSGGPSYMLLETNGGNKQLIKSFQAAKTPFPVANSLMYSVYKKLPNDTDLTVFREDGNIDGFNFAFIDDHFDYHTAQDSFERMDLNTFHHQASYLLPLLTYFSNEDLAQLKDKEDEVYVNFPFIGLIHYPFSWVLPMTIVSLGIFLILLTIGVRLKKIKVKNVILGFIPLFKAFLFSGVLAYFSWEMLLKIHSQYQDILHGFTYNGHLYITAFVAFTIAICFWVYRNYFKKINSLELFITSLFVWILINIIIVFYLKGSGFFIIPVGFGLLILALQLFSQKKNLLLFTIISIPAIIIISPLIKMFPVGLGLNKMVISTIFTVLLVALLLPIIYQYKNQKSIQKLFFIIGLFSLITATITASYNNDRKKPTSIIYEFDADANKAYWATYNLKTDVFTKQFLGDNPTQGSYNDKTTSSKYKTTIKQYTNAEVKPLLKPIIEVVSDTIINLDRHICFSVLSQRTANKVEIFTKTPIQFKSLIINGEALKKEKENEFVFEVDKGTVLSYFLTDKDELIDIEIIVEKDTEINLDILEIKFDLLENSNFSITPRTSEMIPTPFVINDATIIKKNIKI